MKYIIYKPPNRLKGTQNRYTLELHSWNAQLAKLKLMLS